MNRSETFIYLLSKKPWTDYEWEKQTGITRATFGNNRKNSGQNVKAKTLEVMSKVCGFKLVHVNAKDGINPNDENASFELEENKFKRLELDYSDLGELAETFFE